MLRKPRKINPRNYDAYRAFRLKVLRRDKYKCQMPGCCSKKRLEVHHIARYADSNSGKLNTSNALVLCHYHHHDVVTGNESHYQQLFFSIVRKNEGTNENN